MEGNDEIAVQLIWTTEKLFLPSTEVCFAARSLADSVTTAELKRNRQLSLWSELKDPRSKRHFSLSLPRVKVDNFENPETAGGPGLF